MTSASSAREAYVRQLGEGHGFSLEQLTANREGRIHPLQIERGSRSGMGGAVFAVVLAVLFAAGGVGGALLLYADYGKPISAVDMNGLYALGGGGVFLCFLFLGGALLGFRKVAHRRRVYGAGPASVAEGPLHKVYIEGRGGIPSQWRYVIGGVSFQVSRRAWELTTHGARYRAYHAAGDLLSIEPL